VSAPRSARRGAKASAGRAKTDTADRSANLGAYTAKRDFTRTPEPAPGGEAAGDRSRFVIHEHSATRLHWDLRLERDGVLASWAIPKGLPEVPRENRLAVWTEDHPLAYIDFEGEIPKGQYGAGTMRIWDSGTYETLKWDPRKVEVALHGKRIDARYALFPLSKAEDPREWMIHRMDPPADAEREPMPERIEPMLARTASLPARDDGWAYEVKWDGVRAIARSRPGELRLASRNLKDITARYPELSRLNRALSSHEAVLDGEVVVLDAQGRPSFQALQRRMHLSSAAQIKRLSEATPVTYMIFDLLWLDGHSLMDLPYEERRRRLSELGLRGACWRTPEALAGSARDVLAATAAQGLEGIIAKRLDSAYRPGARSEAWLKIKNMSRQEFVIGGWVPGEGRRTERIGALLVGVHDERGVLRYAGRVGTGFSEQELNRLAALLMPLRRARSPFPPGGTRPPRGAVFCEPRLVAEVEFGEWTRTGSLRHPSYKGLREDKPAEQVVREDAGASARSDGERRERVLPPLPGAKATVSVQGRELKLSNLEKVLYPQAGFAKREVIDYYAEISEALLPHLEGHALTVTRWPDGVTGKSFFQKQAPAHRPGWVATVALPGRSKTIDYVLVDGLPTLLWLANLAALELHVPLHRAGVPGGPDAVVFDLDPGAPAGVLECARVALTLHGMLEHLGLQCFAKTSGSKGIQVYVPLNSPQQGYERTKHFARAVAETFAGTEPELVVSQMTRSLRGGKVLIDWSQNDPNKTTVCAYSLRATELPGVSTPLEWDELRRALGSGDPSSLAFTPGQTLERVARRGDLLAPLLSLVQRLPDL
jgi:bifunctional non-homologous end joining protein LigD